MTEYENGKCQGYFDEEKTTEIRGKWSFDKLRHSWNDDQILKDDNLSSEIS
jgi:hypothetical protein